MSKRQHVRSYLITDLLKKQKIQRKQKMFWTEFILLNQRSKELSDHQSSHNPSFKKSKGQKIRRQPKNFKMKKEVPVTGPTLIKSITSLKIQIGSTISLLSSTLARTLLISMTPTLRKSWMSWNEKRNRSEKLKVMKLILLIVMMRDWWRNLKK